MCYGPYNERQILSVMAIFALRHSKFDTGRRRDDLFRLLTPGKVPVRFFITRICVDCVLAFFLGRVSTGALLIASFKDSTATLFFLSMDWKSFG